MSSTCKPGFIKRVGYTKKSGIRVKSKCIPATSQSGLKRSTINKAIMRKKTTLQRKASKKFGVPKCKKGQIMRQGYFKKATSRKTRKNKKMSRTKVKSSWARPTCIKDVGAPGKGPKLIGPLNKGTLGRFGYTNVLGKSMLQRRSALRKASKRLNPLTIARKLTAVSTLSKKTNPRFSQIARSDAKWVKTLPAYLNRPSAKKLKNN